MGPGRLAGCRVLLTRPAEQAEPWRRVLAAEGAIVLDYPTIEVGPPADWAPLERALARLTDYQWLVFTSANAVRFTFARWPAAHPSPTLASPRVAAVGAQTARALLERGFVVARLPELESGDGLIAAFADLPAGTRVLFPQAVGGREALADALRARGCTVDVVAASQTIARGDLPPPPAFDAATFASPSALRAFVQAHGPGPLAGRPLVVIGATTAAEAEAHGLRPTVARAPRIEEVVEALAVVYAGERGES